VENDLCGVSAVPKGDGPTFRKPRRLGSNASISAFCSLQKLRTQYLKHKCLNIGDKENVFFNFNLYRVFENNFTIVLQTSVAKTFTLKGVQTIYRSTPWTTFRYLQLRPTGYHQHLKDAFDTILLLIIPQSWPFHIRPFILRETSTLVTTPHKKHITFPHTTLKILSVLS
jgi:hypothetical protein